jgi:hypothetical protein
VIDKLDVEIQPNVDRYKGEVAKVREYLRDGCEDIPGVTRGRDYRWMADLRVHGLEAKLHIGCRHRPGNDKLELLEVGNKTFEDALTLVEKIVTGDPLTRRVMRLDLAADVPDVSISTFKAMARAQFKRWLCEHGRLELEYSEMGMRRIQTLYFGKRPAVIRIYNKIDEWRGAYERRYKVHLQKVPSEIADGLTGLSAYRLAGVSPDAETPTFEDFTREQTRGRAAYRESDVLSRVERQIPAARMPRQLLHDRRVDMATVWQRLPISDQEDPRFFNPFERIKFLSKEFDGSAIDFSSVNSDDYAFVRGVAALIEDMGYHAAYKILNQQRNASRIFRKYQSLLPKKSGASGASAPIDENRLLTSYQMSIREQLAA